MTQPLPKPVRAKKPRRPLRRTKPLAKGKPPKRASGLEPGRLRSRKPMKKSNPVRRAKKYARNYGEHRPFVVSLECAIRVGNGQPNPWRIVPAHVVATGAGGCKGDWRDLVCLSYDLHLEQHRIGVRAFQEKYGVNLFALRHVLVVADPGVDVREQLAAWKRLHEEHTGQEVIDALGRGFLLTGREIAPPTIAVDSTEI